MLERAGRLGGQIYLRTVVVPWLRSRGLLSPSYTVAPAYGGVLLLDDERACKVGLSPKNTIRSEFNKAESAARRWPALRSIFPDGRLEGAPFIACLTMSRYEPVALEESLGHALRLYKAMGACRSAPTQGMSIAGSAELAAGLDVVTRLYDAATAREVRCHVEATLSSGACTFGFAHGDFHSRNILVDRGGAPRLIDLDCVRLNGIQELDALYFVVEMEWSRSGTWWARTLGGILRGTISDDNAALLRGFGVSAEFGLCVTFFVDRIGQGSLGYGLGYSREALDPVVRAIVEA